MSICGSREMTLVGVEPDRRLGTRPTIGPRRRSGMRTRQRLKEVTMSDEGIRVYVVEFGDRAYYQLQWRDPITGRLRTKSTRLRRSGLARDFKVAERMAGELEAKLNAGEAVIPSRFLWEHFRARYEAEVVPGLAPRTGEKITSVFDRFEADINPRRLWDVDEKRLSAFVSKLRKGEGGKRKLAESTIAGHLAHLKAALNWAKLQKLIAHLPGFPRIKRAKMSKGAKVMRGRPITTEEFERMLGRVDDVVGQAAADDWIFLCGVFGRAVCGSPNRSNSIGTGTTNCTPC